MSLLFRGWTFLAYYMEVASTKMLYPHVSSMYCTGVPRWSFVWYITYHVGMCLRKKRNGRNAKEEWEKRSLLWLFIFYFYVRFMGRQMEEKHDWRACLSSTCALLPTLCRDQRLFAVFCLFCLLLPPSWHLFTSLLPKLRAFTATHLAHAISISQFRGYFALCTSSCDTFVSSSSSRDELLATRFMRHVG